MPCDYTRWVCTDERGQTGVRQQAGQQAHGSPQLWVSAGQLLFTGLEKG